MEILWKDTVSALFQAIRLKLCRNCAFPQNFHTRKLGEITVFLSVFAKALLLNFQGKLYWSELHRHKEGRTVIFSKNVYNIHGDTQQWTTEEYSAVSTVHEYGGGAFFVNEGNVYFMNSKVSQF